MNSSIDYIKIQNGDSTFSFKIAPSLKSMERYNNEGKLESYIVEINDEQIDIKDIIDKALDDREENIPSYILYSQEDYLFYNVKNEFGEKSRKELNIAIADDNGNIYFNNARNLFENGISSTIVLGNNNTPSQSSQIIIGDNFNNIGNQYVNPYLLIGDGSAQGSALIVDSQDLWIKSNENNRMVPVLGTMEEYADNIQTFAENISSVKESIQASLNEYEGRLTNYSDTLVRYQKDLNSYKQILASYNNILTITSTGYIFNNDVKIWDGERQVGIQEYIQSIVSTLGTSA